ncbi:MAG: hypothetical protein MUC47_07435 [Candidatus Kapabacteria bacterium]|nr:hypothetical protein [Candidatus Kapabacteria bacterium]
MTYTGLNLLRWLLLPMLIVVLASPISKCRTRTIGAAAEYRSLAEAARDAQPGDTLLIVDREHRDESTVDRLRGTAAAWITVRGIHRDSTSIVGGRGLQFIDPVYLRIEHVTMIGQESNSINIDDGGTFDTPAHHIEVRECGFFGTGDATENIDLLKMSGVDTFLIENIEMAGGSSGGSGIDMVGCHDGTIRTSIFRSMGSNAIQAKGGTARLVIQGNVFANAGARAINCGGSTGYAFFRPQNAPHEAADLLVAANVFVGGTTSVAYVGCERVDVVNNTMLYQTRWVARVLQETVDPQRFVPCRNNSFRNNIVVFDNRITTTLNLGANTAPETFTFSNNLWYRADDPSRSQPVLPVTETGSVIGRDPAVISMVDLRVDLPETSPAVGAGLPFPGVTTDLLGRSFANPPSIGASEGGRGTTSVDLHGGPYRIHEEASRFMLFSLDGVLLATVDHPSQLAGVVSGLACQPILAVDRTSAQSRIITSCH